MEKGYLELTEEERKRLLNYMLAKAHKKLCLYVEDLMWERCNKAMIQFALDVQNGQMFAVDTNEHGEHAIRFINA